MSAAVRATHDPHVISDHLVRGFGETFGADRVLFTTFDDDRVHPDSRPVAPSRPGPDRGRAGNP